MNRPAPAAPDDVAIADPKLILDADTGRMLAKLTAEPFLDPSMTVEQMRAAFERFYGAMYAGRAQVVDVENRTIDGEGGSIAIRLYRPRESRTGPTPMLVFFHGGGSIMGGLDSYDAVCQELCRTSGCVVSSVAYRLAPEHAFSSAVEDCFDAVVWAHANATELGVDAGRIAVGGESGGGGLAAIVTQLARERAGPPIAFQLLIYPYVGARERSGSMKEFAKGFFFDADTLEGFIDLNFADRSALRDWRVSPIWARTFEGLPPAFIVTAGADILRDDAEDYGRRLRAAGVPVETSRYEGTIHGFVCMFGEIDSGRRALHDCGARLRAALGG